MDNGSQHLSEPSFVSLLGGIANDAKELLLQEVALTKLEVQYELRKAKTAAIALGIGIGIVATGGILLMLMLVHVLAALTMVPLWGCYGIVGSALVVLGSAVLVLGKTKGTGRGASADGGEDKGECAMADKADDIRHEIKKGRQNIADTRSAMTEKLARLEDRVQETVDGVKHTFDLHYQVKQRPWLMFGGSVLVGYMLGPRGGVSSTTVDTFKGAAFGAVISTLWAMAKQVLLPPPRRIDGAITKSGAQPIDGPQITNRVITSKTNGRSEV